MARAYAKENRNLGARAALGGRAAIAAAGALIGVMFMGSTLLTPLYALYRREYGFSVVTITLLYSVYVVGNLAALLVLGRLSDKIGRRRVALPAMALAALSALVFLVAPSPPWLFVARVLSGFSIGLAAGAGAAWLAELIGGDDRALASTVATASNFVGIALGPLLAGVLAQYAPAPLRLPFVAYLICVAAVAAPVALTRETIARPRPVREGVSLVPKLGVPRSVLPAFVAPAVSVFITMALVGFYAALSPTLIQQVMRVTNLASGATVSSVMFLVTAVAIVATRNLGDRQAMLGGLALMGPSVALLVAAQATRSMPLMLGGAAVTGVAAALGYRGSLQVVNRIAPPARRAEAVSTYYLCGFIGNALPVIGVGVITMTAGALTASAAFAALIALLAIAALVAGLKAPDRDQSLARST